MLSDSGTWDKYLCRYVDNKQVNIIQLYLASL